MQRLLRVGHIATQATASHFVPTLPISMTYLIPINRRLYFTILTVGKGIMKFPAPSP